MDPPLRTTKVLKTDSILSYKMLTAELAKDTSVDASVGKERCNGRIDEPLVYDIPWLPPPFCQRLKYKMR